MPMKRLAGLLCLSEIKTYPWTEPHSISGSRVTQIAFELLFLDKRDMPGLQRGSQKLLDSYYVQGVNIMHAFLAIPLWEIPEVKIALTNSKYCFMQKLLT
jgi:hypothetical protein